MGELDSRQAWVQAVATAVATFATFGVAYSFGAFFESVTEEFDSGSGATAFVFALTISLSFLLAPVTGRFADRHGPRPVLLAGAVFLAVGLLATTITPTLWVGYLTYGVGVGAAVACAYVPMVANVGGWFVRHRTAALGLAVAGIGLGTLVANPLAAALIDATSWRTTFVVFAVAGALLLVGCAVVVAPGPGAISAASPRSLVELMRRRDFALLYGSMMLTSLALFVPFVFLPSYAEDGGTSDVAAAALVGLIGGASVVGRLALGTAAVRVGAARLYVSSIAAMAGSYLLWYFAGDSYGVLVVYALVLGVGYGGFIAIAPAVVAERFGLEGLGGVLGTLYTSAAVGALIGPPLAGVIIDGAGYDAAILAAFVVSILATVALLPFFGDRLVSQITPAR